MKLEQRTCGCGCDRSMAGKPATAKYATPACGSRARRAQQRRLRDLVLAIFAEPAPDWRRCENCGDILQESQRKDARFCGGACKAAAARERLAEAPEPAADPADPPDLTEHPLPLPRARVEKPTTVRKPAHAEKDDGTQRSGYTGVEREKRTERPQRRDRARIEDLRFVVRRWHDEELTPCTYCGMPADTQDHVLPRAYIAQLAQIDVDLPRHMLIVVPCCRECNSVAGAKIFKTLSHKRAFLRDRLIQRYSKALGSHDFTKAELAEFGPTLRSKIEQGIALKAQVNQRIDWANRRLPPHLRAAA